MSHLTTYHCRWKPRYCKWKSCELCEVPKYIQSLNRNSHLPASQLLFRGSSGSARLSREFEVLRWGRMLQDESRDRSQISIRYLGSIFYFCKTILGSASTGSLPYVRSRTNSGNVNSSNIDIKIRLPGMTMFVKSTNIVKGQKSQLHCLFTNTARLEKYCETCALNTS